MADYNKRMEDKLEELRSQKAALETLLQCEGQKLLEAYSDNYRRATTRHIVQEEGEGLDGLIETSKSKAYLAGFQHRDNLAEMMLEEISAEIKEILEHLESEE